MQLHFIVMHCHVHCLKATAIWKCEEDLFSLTAGAFVSALSNAFFTPPNPEDVANVRRWHAEQVAKGNGRGLSEQELDAKPPSFWRNRCRVTTREAGDMIAHLNGVMQDFSRPDGPGLDLTTGSIVTTGATAQVHQNVIKLVLDSHVCGEQGTCVKLWHHKAFRDT